MPEICCNNCKPAPTPSATLASPDRSAFHNSSQLLSSVAGLAAASRVEARAGGDSGEGSTSAGDVDAVPLEKLVLLELCWWRFMSHAGDSGNQNGPSNTCSKAGAADKPKSSRHISPNQVRHQHAAAAEHHEEGAVLAAAGRWHGLPDVEVHQRRGDAYSEARQGPRGGQRLHALRQGHANGPNDVEGVVVNQRPAASESIAEGSTTESS
mmetsp:Transcript_84652/g.238123  ORF Transcript_84652/g.238123 Transcript_84652/m.238123 type:complete len:210 (-) Transcript_84652:375-1004(-)